MAGRSAAVATGPTVYVGSNDAALYAVDAGTGNLRWAFTDPSLHLSPSPTVVDGTIYIGSGGGSPSESGALYAVDAATGEQVWTASAPGLIGTPTVTDGTVYFPANGTFGEDREDSGVFAVDAATGDQEWAFTYPSSRIGSAPTVIDDPEAGDSVGLRVARGTLGHHHVWADNSPAVTGTVLGEVTSDAGEQLAEVEVTLVNEAGEATSAYTGADGSYAVEVVPGTYDLVVEKLGFAPFETVVVVHKHLETERDIDLTSLKPGGLRGAVTDADSDPLADVEIRCYHDGTLIDTATTDETGEYALALAVGLYEVVATADGYAPVSEPVELTSSTP